MQNHDAIEVQEHDHRFETVATVRVRTGLDRWAGFALMRCTFKYCARSGVQMTDRNMNSNDSVAWANVAQTAEKLLTLYNQRAMLDDPEAQIVAMPEHDHGGAGGC